MKMNISFAEPNINSEQARFSKDEKGCFHFLTEIPKFVEFVRAVRKDCSIPIGGISKNWSIAQKLFKSIDFPKLITISIALTERQGLAKEWTSTFIALLLGFPLTKPVFPSNPIEVYQQNGSVFIKVENYISNTELGLVIRQDKKLKTLLKELPKTTVKIKQKNIVRDLTLKRLHEQLSRGEKTMKKVLDFYYDKKPTKIELSPEEARRYIDRLNKYFDAKFNFEIDTLAIAIGASTIEKQLKDT